MATDIFGRQIKRTTQSVRNSWDGQDKIRAAAREVFLKYRTCCFCDCELTEETFTADHLTPLGRGGTNDAENIEVCCEKCNAGKKLYTLEEYAPLKAKKTFKRIDNGIKVGEPMTPEKIMDDLAFRKIKGRAIVKFVMEYAQKKLGEKQ